MKQINDYTGKILQHIIDKLPDNYPVWRGPSGDLVAGHPTIEDEDGDDYDEYIEVGTVADCK